MVVLGLVWTTADPGNPSTVRNGEVFKTGENMGGAVEWSVIKRLTDKVKNLHFLLNCQGGGD